MEIIKTSLPLTDEQLDKYFDNIDDYLFSIDVDKSSIKGETLLNYIYNSTMQCELCLHEYNEKLEELLVAFISTNKLIDIPVLEDMLCSLVEYSIDTESNTDAQFCEFANSFILKHSELIDELANILYSLNRYLICKINSKEEDFYKLDDNKIIHTGNNIVSLKNSPTFWHLLINKNFQDRKAYNYSDFNELKYDGKKIFYYFLNDCNPFGIAYAIKEVSDLEERNTDKNL